METTQSPITVQPATTPEVPRRRSHKLIPWDSQQIAFLKQLKFPPNTPDNDVRAALAKAATLGVDPLADEVYFVNYGGNLVTQVGIHGLTRKADESGHFRGFSLKRFVVSRDKGAPIQIEEWELDPEKDRLIAAMATAQRDDDSSENPPAPYVARYAEYVSRDSQGNPNRRWKQAGPTQLMKCAKAGSLRERFTLGSLYLREELERDTAITVESREVGTLNPDDLQPSTDPNRGHSNEQLDKPRWSEESQTTVFDESGSQTLQPDKSQIIAAITERLNSILPSDVVADGRKMRPVLRLLAKKFNVLDIKDLPAPVLGQVLDYANSEEFEEELAKDNLMPIKR